MKNRLAQDSLRLKKGVDNALLHFDVILNTWSDYQDRHQKRVTSIREEKLDPQTMEKLAEALYRLRNLIDDAYQLRDDLISLVSENRVTH